MKKTDRTSEKNTEKTLSDAEIVMAKENAKRDEEEADKMVKKSKFLREETDGKPSRDSVKAKQIADKQQHEAEQKQKEKEESRVAPLQAIQKSLENAKNKIKVNRNPDGDALRWIKYASMLKINDGRAKIDEIVECLTALKGCLQVLPGSDKKHEIDTSLSDIESNIDTLKEVCNELTANMNNLLAEDLPKMSNISNCIDYILGQVKAEIENKDNADFGSRLLGEAENDSVIKYAKEAEELSEEINVQITHLKDTPDEFDDNLIMLYENLDHFVTRFAADLSQTASLELANNDIKADKGMVTEDVSKMFEGAKNAKETIDEIVKNYTTMGNNLDALTEANSTYAVSEFEKSVDIFEDYENNMTGFCESFNQANNQNNIVKISNAIIEEGKKLGAIYGKFEESYKNCRVALVNAVNADITAINDRFGRVKPTVPECSATGRIYVRDTIGFKEVTAQQVDKDGMATITLSTVFAPYIGMSYQDLLKLDREFRWCSLAAFKEYGFISQDTQRVFIVDDGYLDYGIDKNAFAYFQSTTRCFSAVDVGKIYFSESAMKKFKQIIGR